tara:strand:+ start:793 stop:1953 length:1161 start_codon:yes stop_codon:yes gene_type:complete
MNFNILKSENKFFDNPIGTSGLSKPEFDSFINYSRHLYSYNKSYGEEYIIELLENKLSEFHETKYCISMCSGFWAIALTIDSLKIRNRSDIILPSLTYRRLADLVSWCNLKPRFCEVDKISLSINPSSLDKLIDDNTSLILGVHPIINTCDTKSLKKIADINKIPLIMDSVESVFEKTFDGRVGSQAKAEVFSLHASKLINGGEGGYITTSDKSLYDHLVSLRNYGFLKNGMGYNTDGMNAKINVIHACMALANLENLDKFIKHNKKIYEVYKKRLKDIKGISLLEFEEGTRPSYKNVVVEINNYWPLTRDETIILFNKNNILARKYYSPPLHKKEMNYPYNPANLPITESLSKKFILMPSGFQIRENDIHRLCDFLILISKNKIK